MKYVCYIFIFLLNIGVSIDSFSQVTNTEENTILYWDASYGMRYRNIDAEVAYLQQFFENHPTVTVTFIAFSNEIIQEMVFHIENAKWDALKEELYATVYDGASSFRELDFTKNVAQYILSSDGKTFFDDLPKASSKPIHIINSVYKDDGTLQILAANSGGSYTGLGIASKKTINRSFPVKGIVRGEVNGMLVPLEGVTIIVEKQEQKSVTDIDGAFEITVKRGDVVRFSFVGRETQKIRIGDRKYYDVQLDFSGDELEEVILRGDAAPEDQLLTIGGQSFQKKRLGYAVQRITDKEISSLDLDVKQAVNGQFSNISIANDAVTDRFDLSQFLGRGKNMSILLDQTGLIVLDGVPMESRGTTANTFGAIANTLSINPDNISSVTYLKGLAATNRYGTLGRNGVLVITTKTHTVRGTEDLSTSISLGTTDTYEGNPEEIALLPDTPYINELRTATSVNQAYDMYLKQRDFYGQRPTFFMDVAQYFRGWKQPQVVKRVLSNITEIASENPEALRAMSFAYQELNDVYAFAKAYEHIFKLRPEEVQSHLDLARAYDQMGDVQKAFTVYQNIVHGTTGYTLTIQGLKKTIDAEYRNFVSRRKSRLNLNLVPEEYLLPNEIQKRRIVVSWNDPRASFDLQIINPQMRYFTWSHSEEGASQRLEQEKRDGFASEEFFLTSGDTGTWSFNLVNYGFTEGDYGQPVYIKFTVYDDWGTPYQLKRVKLVRLSDIEKEVNALTLRV